MNDPILYLDHAATTPLRPAVAEAIARFRAGGAGNPSSSHAAGRIARAALEDARERVADALGARRQEIVFTGGGTEADNLAVLGRWRAVGGGIALSAIEHSAVREAAARAGADGARVVTLAVDEAGRLDLGALDEALEEELAVVSVMWANNEIGTIEPVREVAERCAARGVAFHTDAVQAVGHVPVRVDDVGCSLLSISAHKIGGPTGVGALFVRTGTALEPLSFGGGQERGLRAGTHDVAGAVGLAESLELAVTDLERERARLARLRDRLEGRLLSAIPDLVVNAGAAERLPQTLSVGVDGVTADVLLASLDLAGLAVSSGSACHTGAAEPSHVLVAIGARQDATIRFSLGWSSTEAEVDRAADLFADAVDRTRAGVHG